MKGCCLKFAAKRFRHLFTGILLAGGQGLRMGTEAKLPKQFLELKPLYTILEKSFQSIAPFVKKIILVLPSETQIDPLLLERLEQLAQDEDIQLLTCQGGKRRQDSVNNALEQVNSEYLLIHDSARPLTSYSDICNLLEAVLEHKAAILAVPATDTIKQVDANGLIQRTLPREQIYLAQTPQAFETELYRLAVLKAQEKNTQVTDDASLLEAYGHAVKVVCSGSLNLKITERQDYLLIKSLMQIPPTETT